jgi:hypothetical protein
MSINPEVDRGLVDCDLGSGVSARLAIKAKSPHKNSHGALWGTSLFVIYTMRNYGDAGRDRTDA